MLPKRAIEHVLAGTLREHYRDLIDIKHHPSEPFVLLNYTEMCTYRRHWDEVTRASRGLIVHAETGEVIALPFPKFFNLGEVEDTELAHLPDEPFAVFEKLDGSMGVLYRDSDDALHLATRGAFASSQALRGTELLRACPGLAQVPAALTLIVEIIHPQTRVVVDYGAREELVLLGIRDRLTGAELPWPEVEAWARRIGMALPQVYHYDSVDALIAAKQSIPGELEGFVVRFAGGARIKIKGDAYLSLYRMKKNVSRKAIVTALSGGTWDAYIQSVPEEFRSYAERSADDVRRAAGVLEAEVRAVYAQAPDTDSQKQFALWVQSSAPTHLRRLLFDLRKGATPDWIEHAARLDGSRSSDA